MNETSSPGQDHRVTQRGKSWRREALRAAPEFPELGAGGNLGQAPPLKPKSVSLEDLCRANADFT